MTQQQELLTPKQIASVLQVSLGTLENWRATGQGPAWIKLGDKPNSPVRYAMADIHRFITEMTTCPTK